MKLFSSFSVLAAGFSLITAHPKHGPKPLYFALAGDSTTAVQSSGGGGWGDGFLNYTLHSPSTGHNYGHDGATTVSFRAGGDWANVLSDARDHTKDYELFVTIQFGHNDQKPAANISLAEYATNLGVFVDDVREAGAQPILVTPLTRRQFDDGKVVESLANERNTTIAVAEAKKSRWVDLNIGSENYCNAIGQAACWKYNLNSTSPQILYGNDTTHLNDYGSIVFGRLVSDLMVEKYRDIRHWTKPNATLSYELSHGIAA